MDRPLRQEQQPPDDQVIEVAPGVLRMQLPISMPGLGHVNCYAMVDDRGATIVDTGLPGRASYKALQHRLAQAELKVADVHTVVITHSHPDHFGNAGRLARNAGAEIVTHENFRTGWHQRRPDPCDDPDADLVGAKEGEAESWRDTNPWGPVTPWGSMPPRPPWRRRLAWKAMRSPLVRMYVDPVPTRRLRDGEVFRAGGRDWTVMFTPGHTLDHICLHDPSNAVLLSGDHVLPTITPHISGVGSGQDPLSEFVSSLDRVGHLDDQPLVLPAHGQPFNHVAERVEEIKEHHGERLARLADISAALGPASVTDISHELFKPRSWGTMAESETYAHLEHLRLAGKAERHPDGNSLIYTVAPVPAGVPHTTLGKDNS
ncbi:MAG: MBL fold metallo-hydrolase [Acidimicrobiales bacterium]